MPTEHEHLNEVPDADVGAFFRDTLREKRKWLFLADNDGAHREVAALAAAVVAEGLPAGAVMDYGSVDWMSSPSLARYRLSFLAVPRAAKPDLVDVVRALSAGRDADMVCLSEHPRALGAFLRHLLDGTATVVADPSAN